MNVLRWGLVICLVAGLAAGRAAAKEKTNKEKIVGLWELSKGETVPEGSTMEFTKDGKVKMTINDKGKEVKMEAKYKVDEDKLSLTLLGPDGKVLKGPDGKEAKETVTITKLTDKEFEVKDKNGKVDKFTKKKK